MGAPRSTASLTQPSMRLASFSSMSGPMKVLSSLGSPVFSEDTALISFGLSIA